jgi:hypothetical protein
LERHFSSPGKVIFVTHLLFSQVDGEYSSLFVSDFCLVEFDSVYLYIPVVITFGYLLYDLILIYTKLHTTSEIGKQIYIHHVVGLGSVIVLVIFGEGGPINVANVILINEISTFFLNYRIFLLDFKMNESRLYVWNGMCFLGSFLIFRIILNTALFWYIGKLWIILTAKY